MVYKMMIASTPDAIAMATSWLVQPMRMIEGMAIARHIMNTRKVLRSPIGLLGTENTTKIAVDVKRNAATEAGVS